MKNAAVGGADRLEDFMCLQRRRLEERREGILRRALGDPLPGETKAQLDRIGEADRIRACHGFVAVVGSDGRASYRHIEALGGEDIENKLAAEWLEEGWLKQRAKRRMNGAGALPVPKHLR
jgi:hypothetical protein